MIDFAHLLIVHSYFRWLVLTMMLMQGIWIWKSYKTNKVFTGSDFNILILCTIIYNIQLVLGWCLFFNSIIVEAFWKDLAVGIKNRQLRFFGLEHMSMMTLGIILVNISSYRASKYKRNVNVFKQLWKTYIWIFLIILSSIPWSFSPLTSRPDFR